MTTLPLAQAAAARRTHATVPPAVRTEPVLTRDHCDELRGFAALTEDLRHLRADATRATPNNHPAIYAATVAARAEAWRPSVTMFRTGDRPRAAILARRSTRRIPLRLGYLTLRSPAARCLDVVYGGLLHDGSGRSLAAIADELRRVLRQEVVDHIMINHLPLDDPIFEMITDRGRFPSASRAGEIQPHRRFVLSPGPFEETLQRFSRKHRYNLRRSDRVLREHCEGDLELAIHDDPTGLEGLLREAETISRAGYQGRVAASSLATPLQHAVLCAAEEAGALRCYLLRGKGEAIAYQMGAVIDGVYWLFSTAFLPAYERFSPGQVLLLRVLDDLAALDVRIVDYGFGDAPYKRMYGSTVHDEATVHLYADTPRGIAARLMHESGEGAARRLRATLDRIGLLPRIKKHWRRRLAAPAGERPAC